ncbi:uncharacterized protein EKO05_0008326 [Ascochyta rabiei]|uniref:Uncharacterized protein n=1 Tax=Didymella rabiei TaxID=5454 RepID=A0A163DDR4_DIDRA|nr:uncharacterized protein EKO05_0008326 [Ascochyta rabiei]KZM23097.1 hypothetical protein ST47_g5721 [Ascochyta rabiei]UPX18002.1 hypothetical protein EKO05_0008326 [Ascochyta rabiei]
MQLAALENDPSTYDRATLREEVDEALPDSGGLFVDITLASLQEESTDVDWLQLDQELENGPWRGVFDKDTCVLGADMQLLANTR